MKKILVAALVVVFAGLAGVATLFVVMSSDLPQLVTVADYKPLLVSEVYDRNGKKIGEFFREKRTLISFAEIPKPLLDAFVAAEDSSFFKHEGINYLAILRAMIANRKAGRKVQGGSTITQQVARSLLLSSEKTYTRKIKEAILARRMEAHLSKEDILYLYLNQIYLGQGAYGVAQAANIYFRKPVQELTLAECAILAGLPQAPSRYSPISNPKAAKERQLYVLSRMADEGFVTREEADTAAAQEVDVFVFPNYRELAPFFVETVRQMLTSQLGESMVLDKGLRIYTSLDLDLQLKAQTEVQEGLRAHDKRLGYRGPQKNLQTPEEIAEFLLESRNKLMDDSSPSRTILVDGTFRDKGPLNLAGVDEKGEPLPSLPSYLQPSQIVPAVVTKVDDKWGIVFVRFAESRGVIDIESMKWARPPDPNTRATGQEIQKPSQVLKVGDVVDVRIRSPRFAGARLQRELSDLRRRTKGKFEQPKDFPDFTGMAEVELEQEPEAEGSLLAFDQKTSDILAMVGGYDFMKSQFNRSLQAARQTGSAFKALVYAAALDRGYTPGTPIIDAPIVYEEDLPEEGQDEGEKRTWRPSNFSQKFTGDILFRNALIQSLNIPTVKIIEKITVPWAMEYARRLGIFSPLNPDFTLALGSSSVTLYEMTRAFGILGRMGKRLSPVLIHKVTDAQGELILDTVNLDARFAKELTPIEAEFAEKREALLKELGEHPEGEPFKTESPLLYFQDPDQLVRPQMAYVITTILQAAIEEPGGTGGAARALGRPVAGKTGSTNGYFDAWFVGYTPDVVAGVWVGYDREQTLGRGEVGGRAALPIWLEFMKAAHEGLPERNFSAPDGVVFVNIDNQTGQPATPSSSQVVRQAFIEGTEPTLNDGTAQDKQSQEEQDFYKEDLAE